MIAANTTSPEQCIDCPCVYWIMTGQYEGRAMCALMERINNNQGTPERYLVDERAKPKWCPMIDLILPKKCRYCGRPLIE